LTIYKVIKRTLNRWKAGKVGRSDHLPRKAARLPGQAGGELMTVTPNVINTGKPARKAGGLTALYIEQTVLN